jgi:DNA mismatch repair protein MutL
VVERPASIVKELLENSIDANSTRITIELESAGKKLIRVTDDGMGIKSDELKLAFEKHSTSKISNIKDVYHLSTLGFRGEALASIAAVARVECISCFADRQSGRKLVLEGGSVKSFTEVGCPKGTTIKVMDLFFNLPARFKYLKSDQTELAHIIDVITHLAIFHNRISFKVIHNGHELLNFPATNNQINNLINIYGKELARELLPLQGPEQLAEISSRQMGKIKIQGFIGKPSVTRSDRSYQSVYVNGRYVDSKVVNDAIKESYRSLVMKNRYPLVILFIELNPGAIDVNISPTKLQIRFEDDKEIFKIAYKFIHNTLKSNDLIPEAKLPQRPHTVTLKAITTLGIGKPGILPSIQSVQPTPAAPGQQRETDKNILKPMDSREGQRGDTLKPEITSQNRIYQYHQDILRQKATEEIKSQDDLQQTPKASTLMRIHPIGQVLDTYILAQAGENLLIIDQHAAAERIMYEKIRNRYNSMTMSVQELLEPVELELSPRELGLLKSSLETLKDMSFIIDELGENKFYVKGIPIILGRLQDRELIHDIINDLVSATGEKQQEHIKDKMIQIMACKAALKAGKPLNIPEIQQLLHELYKIENPYTCAHGRPTIISLTDIQLRKLFKRIV